MAFLSTSSLSGFYAPMGSLNLTCPLGEMGPPKPAMLSKRVEEMANDTQAPSNPSTHNNVFRDVTLGLKKIVQRAITFRERIILVKN